MSFSEWHLFFVEVPSAQRMDYSGSAFGKHFFMPMGMKNRLASATAATQSNGRSRENW